MHAAAHDYVARVVGERGPFVSVLEIGSRDVNGGIRDLFDHHDTVFEGVDIAAGPGVDWVVDASVSLPAGPYDCVVSCEVFEHTARWPRIVRNASRVLMDGGVLSVTMAGPGRAPHSAVDGGQLRCGEWYRNVEPECLRRALAYAGFDEVDVDVLGGDVRATGVKRAG